jgi:hypothetical protein
MNTVRAFATALALIVSVSCVFGMTNTSVASTITSEITDMWGTDGETGWGVNITLQNDVAFATFFVYDANGNPVWYASDMHYQGNFVWSGNLYATHWPWFGGAYNSGTDRQCAAGGIGAGVPSSAKRVGAGSLTQTPESPENPGRFSLVGHPQAFVGREFSLQPT